jgi:hypothetical protein
LLALRLADYLVLYPKVASLAWSSDRARVLLVINRGLGLMLALVQALILSMELNPETVPLQGASVLAVQCLARQRLLKVRSGRHSEAFWVRQTARSGLQVRRRPHPPAPRRPPVRFLQQVSMGFLLQMLQFRVCRVPE